MIYRPLYVEKIMAYVDTPFVKILTGVRRCGKSTILKMIMERLKTQHNISEERIVSCRYTVNVGKSGSSEIDFVAVRQNEKLYVQVTQELHSLKTEKGEFDRLLEIHDNYPKYVLTTDEFSGGNYEGIKTMHIADFLLSSEY